MTQPQPPQTLREFLAPLARRAEEDLRRWTVPAHAPEALAEAMRYSVLGGGKRLRPALVYLGARAGGGGDAPCDLVRRAAVAVELVHCYSLVHDDLPAMDDDALRRGRPTVHKQFSEAMAILAGDALLTRAMEILAETGEPPAWALVGELAGAAGAAGMIAGQVADMDLCEVGEGVEGLREIHRWKTGALIRAAARMGALAVGADETALAALTDWAEALGLAFQVYDDILDVTGQADQIGKTPGKDARAGKRTYVSELGLDGAAAIGRDLTARAMAATATLSTGGQGLRDLARLLADRTH